MTDCGLNTSALEPWAALPSCRDDSREPPGHRSLRESQPNSAEFPASTYAYAFSFGLISFTWLGRVRNVDLAD